MRTITAFAAAILCAGAAMAQGGASPSPQLTITSSASAVKVWPPSTPPTPVSVSLSGSAAAPSGIAALEFTFGLPTGATAAAPTAGAASTAASKQEVCGPVTAGSEICVTYGLNQTVYADGDVSDVAVSFPITSATIVPVSLTFGLANALAVAPDGTAVSVTATPLTLPVANPCDLTGDGKVDTDDVNAEVGQIVDTTSCSNGDLIGQGKCDLVSLQRIVNAALGQGCKVGH